jgi:hypothetical protein
VKERGHQSIDRFENLFRRRKDSALSETLLRSFLIMKTEDEVTFPTSLSNTVRGDSSTIIRGCVKKEEEEIRISNRRRRGDNNNNNNNMDGSDMNHDDLNRVRLQPVKKEEEEEEEENDDDDHQENNETYDNYDDWGKGNWCWLLPAKANANANANINDKTRRSKSSVTHNVKSKDGGITASATSTNTCRNARGIVRGRRSVPLDDEDEDGNGNNDDDDDEKKPPGKKMRHCRPINDFIKEEVQEEEEGGDSTYETNNITTNDNDNDNDNDNSSTSINSNNEGDDEKGYESWTEGNWCLVVHFPQARVGKIATAGPSTTTTTRRRRVVRSRNSSHQKSYEEDRSKCNNEDFDNTDNDDAIDVSSTKSKTRKGKIMRYTKWQNELWDKMFQLLVAYKKERKSTNVPEGYKEDPKLAAWVSFQRQRYNSKSISIERINRLESIEFVWKHKDLVPWEEIYQRLVAYKKKHKSTIVPRRYEVDLKLGNWVKNQRIYYNNKQLSTERINRLDSISFVWAPNDARWMEMYSKLIEYKKQNKTSKVPCLYTEDPSFGMWVHKQRSAYNKGNLSEKRLKLLNSINFAAS